MSELEKTEKDSKKSSALLRWLLLLFEESKSELVLPMTFPRFSGTVTEVELDVAGYWP